MWQSHTREEELDLKYPFKCNQCPKKYTCKRNLSRHLRSHEENLELRRPFECNQCPRRFGHRFLLNCHLRIHEKNIELRLSFKCNQCKKGFTTKSSLEIHSRSHEESLELRRPFKCNQCGKRFCSPSKLNRHLRTHIKDTELKFSFKCNQCQKSFSQKCNLNRHRRTHEKDPNLRFPYNYNQYPQTFTQYGYMEAPLQTHEEGVAPVMTDEVKYLFKCSRCGSSFQAEFDFSAHSDFCSMQNPLHDELFTHMINLKNNTAVQDVGLSLPVLRNQFRCEESTEILQHINLDNHLSSFEDTLELYSEKQFIKNRTLLHDAAVQEGNVLIQHNVCTDDELNREESLRFFNFDLESHYKSTYSVSCNICNKCFLEEQALEAHYRLVHKNLVIGEESKSNFEECRELNAILDDWLKEKELL